MKKLAFIACLLVPLGLWLYGKVPVWYAEHTLKNVVRQIPLDDFKQFPTPQLQMPTLVPPHVTKVVPVKPKVHRPAPKRKPVVTKAPPPPLQLEPQEQQPTQFCAFDWFFPHTCPPNEAPNNG